MYKIIAEDNGIRQIMHAADAGSTQRIQSGQLKERVNTTPSMTAALTPQNLCYGKLHERLTTAELINTVTGETEFEGYLLTAPVSMAADGKLRQKLTFEGYMGYLNDSIQMYHTYEDTTVSGFLYALLEAHNAAVPAHKQIFLGTVNISGDNTNSKTTAYRSTLAEIRENLISRLGGEIRVRRGQDGRLLLDYMDALSGGATSGTVVTLGTNLRSLSVETDTTGIITRLIPLGTQLNDETAERLTIEGAVIDGVTINVPYIDDPAGIEKYGVIAGTAEFDDITVKENLYERGIAFFEENNRVPKHYTASVLDISGRGVLRTGSTYRFRQQIMGLDENLRLLGRTVDLLKPYTPTVEIGDRLTRITNITAQTRHLAEITLPQQISQTVQTSKAIASQLINAATTGYVVIRPNEILIMDTDDTATATSVWRWNSGGLGYSHSDTPGAAYSGTYGLAMTMNGQIVADFIAAGYMYADRIRGGTLSMGGLDNVNGVIEVLDASGNTVCRFDKDGAYIFGDVYTENSSGYWLELSEGNLSGGKNGNTYTVMDATTEVTDLIDGQLYTFRGLRIWANAVSFENCKHIGVNNGSQSYIGMTGNLSIPTVSAQTDTLHNVAIVDPDTGSIGYTDLTYVSGVTVSGAAVHIEKGLVTA